MINKDGKIYIFLNVSVNKHLIVRKKLRKLTALTHVQIISLTAWKDYSPQWCTKAGAKVLSSHVQTTQDCINLCIAKNPSCNAVEWWENGVNDCYECIKPSLRTEYNHDTSFDYPPHVLIKPKEAAGKVNICVVSCDNCPKFTSHLRSSIPLRFFFDNANQFYVNMSNTRKSVDMWVEKTRHSFL